MPIGTAVHARTLALCESLNFREWSGYYAVSAYEAHHEHEYNAIRNAAALIDVSPLFKYLVTRAGRRQARRSRHHARRPRTGGRPGLLHALVRRARQGHRRWDRDARLAEDTFRWTAADPSLRWFTQNAAGLNVAHRGHLGAGRGARAAGADLGRRARRRRRRRHPKPQVFPHDARHDRGVPVEISRTGYTGDLGYEIWMPGIARSRSGTR